ncbi:endonuclease VII domain-containing protein [Couchioplanes caeruleus]|uniref:endonuclease VII domain-containing protein n=1 Tax=Couchioplanes caeruleus TaxID=56438 RepID=UPI0020BFF3FE|nr:endonuclease VII domain-containing protein [Couchioplanes caeruleus]UQU68122.1 endonuclease VII domain-containing protein [Couchioplanes caeruleus]
MSDSCNPREKQCPQCLRTLPSSEFHSNRRRPDRLAYYCKRCAAERSEASRRRRGIGQRRQTEVPVPAGSKWCPDCDTTKPLDAFARTKASSSGYHSYCKPCHNARGQETRKRLYGGSREYHLRRRYGIGQLEFDGLLAAQGGVCAICGVDDPQHLDHDHRTGEVRGILCFNCNGGLGQFRDDPVLLADAIAYLKGTTWQRVLIHPGVFQMCSPTRGRHPSRSS